MTRSPTLRPRPGSRFDPGSTALAGLTAGLLLVVVAPVAVVVAGSFAPALFAGGTSEQWAVGPADGAFSGWGAFRWFGYVLHLYRDQLRFSLAIALGSVAVCLAVGVPGAWVLAGRRGPAARWLEALLQLPLALPGVAVAIGLIQAFSAVRGQWWLVLAGHLLYTLPFMVGTVTGALRAADVAGLTRAARSLGANGFQRFWWVVLPNLRHALVVGSLLVFALSWGEFNVSYLLNTPLHQTFPAALYATYTFNSFPVAGAATTLFVGVVLPVLAAIQIVGGREAASKVVQGA